MQVDKLLYPRLAHYLESLPQGLHAYDAVQTRADFSLILRRQLTAQLSAPSFPPDLAAIFQGAWQVGDWIPTTSYVALSALARDALWQSDSDYHEGMVKVASEMYIGAFHRALYMLFGPSLVAMGAAKRWHALHRGGTTLTVGKQNKDGVVFILDYPPRLFNKAGAQSLGAAFCAAATVAKAKKATFVLNSIGETKAEYCLSWTL